VDHEAAAFALNADTLLLVCSYLSDSQPEDGQLLLANATPFFRSLLGSWNCLKLRLQTAMQLLHDTHKLSGLRATDRDFELCISTNSSEPSDRNSGRFKAWEQLAAARARTMRNSLRLTGYGTAVGKR
jgi:hypothetical protein